MAEAVLSGIQDILQAQQQANEALQALAKKAEESEARQDKMIDMLEEALSRQSGQPVNISEEDARNFTQFMEKFLSGQDKRKAPAREAAEKGDFADAVHHLLSVGRQDAVATDDMGRATAETFREAGEIAFFINTANAIEAYENVIHYDGTNAWDYIELSRLYVRGGNLKSALRAAKSGLDTNPDTRDKSVLLDEIGDVARDQGDLVAARQAFEDSLEIRQKLAQSDTSNAGFQRDLAFSHAKIALLNGPDSNAHWKKCYEGLNALFTNNRLAPREYSSLEHAKKMAEGG